MKFNIITLGCKVNSYESNYIRESLENNGFLFCDEENNSDIVIINTCSVTDTSDKKSLKVVRHIRKNNPNSIIVVCGCSSQNNPEIYQNMDINIILGNKDKSKINNLLKEYMDSNNKYFYVDKNRDLPFEDMYISSFDHVRAFIKIQDGCDNFCSYCIIPFVRGKCRCKKYDEIIKEAKLLVKNNFKEIVLTGIHTGSYNDDNHDLCDLINDLSKIDNLERIRLSSVEITELNDKFMDILKNNSKFCNHLHIPLQSGSDNILKLMNRKYNLKEYENIINKIRNIRPNISITTDVIVGFPNETDNDFNNTYKFCKKMNFSKIHVFPYSRRKGTKADLMDNQIDEKIKKNRCHKLIELSNKLEKDYYNKFIGQKLDVLIEKSDDNKSNGHTSNYLMVNIDEPLEVGKIYQRIIK